MTLAVRVPQQPSLPSGTYRRGSAMGARSSRACRRATIGRAPLGLATLLFAACALVAPRPEPPVVSLESLRIEAVSADGARIVVSLALENTNDSAVAIDALDFAIAIAEVPVASGALAAPLTLAARGVARADVVVGTRFSALRAALDATLTRSTIDYEVRGSVTVEGRPLPFTRRGRRAVTDLLGGRR